MSWTQNLILTYFNLGDNIAVRYVDSTFASGIFQYVDDEILVVLTNDDKDPEFYYEHHILLEDIITVSKICKTARIIKGDNNDSKPEDRN